MFQGKGKIRAIFAVLMSSAIVLASCAPAATPTPQVIEKVQTKVVLVTPTPPPPAPLPDVIKIGVFEPMTGAFAAGGQMTYEGIELAHEYKSKVLGKSVEVVLVDNKTDKTEAATAMSRLIEAEKVVGVIGSYGSSLSMAGGEVSEKAGIPVVGCSPTNPLVTKGKKHYCRVCFIDPFQGAVIATYAYQKLGARKVAIIQDIAQDFSIGVTSFFRDKWNALSGDSKTIVALTSYQTGDTDFTAQLTYAIGKKPDAIVTTGYYGEAALLAKQARELGYKGPILGTDALDAPELIKLGGEAVEGVVFSTHFDPAGAITPISKTFLELYRKKYNMEANAFAALGWDAYMVLLDAIERAGSVNGKAISDALHTTKNFEGVTGWITLGENCDAVKSAVIKTVKNGKFEFLTTVEPF